MRDPFRVTSLTRIWRRIRRTFSRNEWVVWLLGLSRTDVKPTEPGLILVQIDGLSKKQFERAVANGRMPFLKSLIEKEQYRQHLFYSGLPSSTPSVQGELYYGVKTIVPSFGFRCHESGRLTRMFESETASAVEARMAKTSRGLLDGGSSYGNIYGGAADEIHFCATSFGWSEFLSTVNPIKLIFLMLLNFWMFFRVAGLMIVELVLATFDFVRRIFSGKELWQELLMIPARVVVVVLLRELVTVGTCYDASRGQPIIHLNLLGYDEQAHRRGPGSRFAHWTLRGIDRSIHRIWNAAHRGAGREYDVWVFSDHGQETTVPYKSQRGKLIQEIVAEMVDASCSVVPKDNHEAKAPRLPTRANWLGVGWLVSMLFGEQDHDLQTRSPLVQTVTSGPLGFVYLLTPEVKARRLEFAQKLVNDFQVPMAVVTEGNQTRVLTTEGVFRLPQDTVQVFGADHPFLADIADDLIRLANHDDSGEILLVGWKHQSQSTSFVLQNGAHAGPGMEETSAFALLPSDIPVDLSDRRYLRPQDLRRAALRFLKRETEREFVPSTLTCRDESIRVMSYNVHACVGMDGELSPERIARVIAQSGANIICLQELDVFRRRSGNRDQAHAIAMHLEMNHQFHPAWHIEEERFGNAILTRFPMKVVQLQELHHHKSDRSRRSALWAEIELNEHVSIQVINTHLSIYPKEQLIQARELMESWVAPASLLGPVILCGDFNARPNSATHHSFDQTLQDVESFDANPTKSTYFSPFPVTRVDHIFVTNELRALNLQVINSRIARIASDHLPLVADLRFDSGAVKPDGHSKPEARSR